VRTKLYIYGYIWRHPSCYHRVTLLSSQTSIVLPYSQVRHPSCYLIVKSDIHRVTLLSSQTSIVLPYSQVRHPSCYLIVKSDTNLVYDQMYVTPKSPSLSFLYIYSVIYLSLSCNDSIYRPIWPAQYFIWYWSVINRTYKCKLRPHRGTSRDIVFKYIHKIISNTFIIVQ
jgi:hypothetical protein